MINSKACTICRQIKDISLFYTDNSQPDKKTLQCKSCRNKTSREWRAKNRERVRENQRLYKAKDPDKVRQAQNTSRAKNREHYNAKAREYARNRPRKPYKPDPEKQKAAREAYYKKNPGYYIKHNQLRKLRLKSITTYEVTTKELNRLMTSPCFYCGTYQNITLDHVVPISRGGTHGIGNLLPACNSCNSSKRERFITEWKKRKSA